MRMSVTLWDHEILILFSATSVREPRPKSRMNATNMNTTRPAYPSLSS